MIASLCFSSSPSVCPYYFNNINKIEFNTCNLLCIPILFNNIRTSAVVDSGAMISVVTTNFVSEYNIATEPYHEPVSLAAQGHTVKVDRVTAPITLRTNSSEVTARFRVLDLEVAAPILLGLDLLPLLGIRITGLPTDYPEPLREITQEEEEFYGTDYGCVTAPEELTTSQKYDQEYVLREIAEILRNNVSIPWSEACSHPDSIISIDTGGATPANIKQYRIPHSAMAAVREQILTWLKNGVVVLAPPGCVWNSPLLAVPKKDAQGRKTKIRTCIDVRIVNSKTVCDDKFPIPLIRDVLESLAGFTYYSSIDLESGYNQFMIRPADRVKLAFTFEGQQYCFARAPFGLKHLPSAFQRVMKQILSNIPHVHVYIDDIVIASSDLHEHVLTIRTVLERLTSYNLRVRPEKCTFCVPCLLILGHYVGSDGLQPDGTKVANVLDWPQPKSMKDMQSFLGLVNYFNEYIPFYSALVEPMNKIKNKKHFEWSKPWTGKLLESFTKVKQALKDCTKLSYPDFSRDFFLATDASCVGLGGVLYQKTDEGKLRYILFCSRSLTKCEATKYSATRLELAAIRYCLKRCRYYLYGRKFTLETDHKALTYVMTQKSLNKMLERTYEDIFEYNFDIVHCPGILNVLPDRLSRLYPSFAQRPDIDEPVTLFSLSRSLINSNWTLNSVQFRRIDQAFGPHTIDLCATDANRQLVRFCSADGDSVPAESCGVRVGNALTASLKGENCYCNPPYDEDFINKILDNVVRDKADMTIVLPVWPKVSWFKRVRSMSVAKPLQLPHSNDLFKPANNDNAVGPPKWGATIACRITGGEVKTSKALKRAIERVFVRVIKAAEKYTPLTPEQIQDLLWRYHAMGHFSVKSIVPNLKADGYHWPGMWLDCKRFVDQCIVCQQYNVVPRKFLASRPIGAKLPMDHLQIDLKTFEVASNEHVALLVMIDVCSKFVWLRPLRSTTNAEVAQNLWAVFSDFGFPKIIQSDNGPEFIGKTITELCRLSCIKKRLITPYNPRADGGVERSIRDIATMINKLIDGVRADWYYMVPQVQLYMNLRTSSIHGSTPFTVMFARPFAGFQDHRAVNLRAMTPREISDRYAQIRDQLFSKVNDTTSSALARRRLALDRNGKSLENPFPDGALVMLRQDNRRSKMQPQYIGPFKVEHMTRGGSYVLRDMLGDLYRRNASPWQLKMVSTDTTVDNGMGNEFYEVEKILNHKGYEGNYLYKILWKGYPASEATWEPLENLNCPDLVHDYWASIGKSVPWKRRRTD